METILQRNTRRFLEKNPTAIKIGQTSGQATWRKSSNINRIVNGGGGEMEKEAMWWDTEIAEMHLAGWKVYRTSRVYPRAKGRSKIYKGRLQAKKGDGKVWDLACLISPFASKISRWRSL